MLKQTQQQPTYSKVPALILTEGFICDCQTAAIVHLSLCPQLTLIALQEQKTQLSLSAILYYFLELHFYQNRGN